MSEQPGAPEERRVESRTTNSRTKFLMSVVPNVAVAAVLVIGWFWKLDDKIQKIDNIDDKIGELDDKIEKIHNVKDKVGKIHEKVVEMDQVDNRILERTQEMSRKMEKIGENMNKMHHKMGKLDDILERTQEIGKLRQDILDKIAEMRRSLESKAYRLGVDVVSLKDDVGHIEEIVLKIMSAPKLAVEDRHKIITALEARKKVMHQMHAAFKEGDYEKASLAIQSPEAKEELLPDVRMRLQELLQELKAENENRGPMKQIRMMPEQPPPE